MIDNPTIQDVLRQFYPKYLEVYTPNGCQAKAAHHILNCKTGAYGANISKCGQCGHIPPKGFVRIRHYGLLSNHNKQRLIPICRNLIGCREFLRRFRNNDKVQAIKILYKKDVTVCPYCGGPVSYQVCSTQLTHRKNST